MAFGKKAAVANPAAETKKKKLKGIAKSCQDILDFVGITEDGIIITNGGVGFSKLYRLNDSNFVTEPEDKQFEVLEKYGKLVSHFPENVTLSIVIINKKNTKQQMIDAYHLKERGDDHNKYRADYNNIINVKVDEGHNDISKTKYLILTVAEQTLDGARATFNTQELGLQELTKEINRAGVDPLGPVERLEVMREILNGAADVSFREEFARFIKTSKDTNGKDVYSLDKKELKRAGVSVKDMIAPQAIVKEPQHLMLNGERYCQSFGYINLPTEMDTVFLTNTTNLPYEMVTVIQLKPCPKKRAVMLVKNQNVSIKADVIKASQQAYKAGYSPELMNEDLKVAQQEAADLRNAIVNEGKKLFYATMVATVFAPDEESLKLAVEQFKGKCTDFSLTPSYLIGQQVQALNMATLVGNSKVIQDRMITSDDARAMFPFHIQELQDKRGHFYGINAVSKSMIMYDRKRSSLANGLVFGISGSGKSFFTKGEIIPNFLDSEDDIIILDPENEYRIVAKEFGGTIIDLDTGSDYHINPCDMAMEWDPEVKANPLVEKSDYMVSIVEAVLGKGRECNPYEVNCIHRCCRKMYEPYMEEMKSRYENGDTRSIDVDLCPTLVDFYTELLRDDTPEANKLASAMEQYCVGNYNLFAHHTNVEVDNRMTVFNLLALPEKMMEMAMKVCLSHIWTRIVRNREENEKYGKGKSIWVYLDEFHHFFKTESSASTIMAYFKRVRKYGGIMTGITQDVADLLQSNQGRAMFNNTGFFAVLNQSPLGRQQLQSLWQIPDTLIDFIKDRPSGMGLIYNLKTLIPFDYKLPNTSELYRIMSTNPHDEHKKKLALEKNAEEAS